MILMAVVVPAHQTSALWLTNSRQQLPQQSTEALETTMTQLGEKGAFGQWSG
jgi:hypothetical protein